MSWIESRRLAAPGGAARRSLALMAAILRAETDATLAQRTASLAFAIRVAGAGITLLSQIALARWMGQSDYGVFAFAWVFVLMAGQFTSLGLPSTAQRFIPEYRTLERHDLARGFAGGSAAAAFALGAVLAGIGGLALWLAEDLVPAAYLVPLYFALSCLPVFGLMDVQDGVSRNFNWMLLGLGLPFIVRPLLLLGLVFAFRAAYGGVDAAEATFAMAVAMWVTALVQLLVVRVRLKGVLGAGARNYRWRTWIATSAPVFLVESFFILLTNADVVVLALFVDAGQVAIYYAAVKVLALVSFVPFSVTAAVSHKYTEYHAAGRREDLVRFVRETTVWTFWPALAATTLALVCGFPLLALFGEGFTDAYPLLFVLGLGLVIRASVGPADRVLNMMGEQKACAVIYGVALALNLALNFAFVPYFGTTAAAWATVATLALQSLLLAQAARKRLGLGVFIVDLPRPRRAPAGEEPRG